MLLSEIYKNRIKELAGIEILSEADQKDIIINKIGLSPELADWVIGLNEKLSIWIANQVQKFNLDKTNESDFRDILDWIKGNQGAINIKKYDFDSAKKEAKKWHDENFKVNNDLVLKDKKIIAQTGPYYWVQLKTVEDCIEEGEAMGHCIGQSSHSGPISRGTHIAFSMRDKDNKPHITIEIDYSKSIIEFKGKQNKIPISKYMDHAVDFLKQKQELWNKITDSTFWNGLRLIYNDEQYFNFFTIKNKELTIDNVADLLQYATDEGQMANLILKYKKENNQKLTDDNVKSLLWNATDKDQMANILGKENINKLTDQNVYYLLEYSQDKDQIANIILKYKGDNLTDYNVSSLLEYSQDKDQIANIILKYKGDNLTDDNVSSLLEYPKDTDQIANIILKYKGDNLTDNNVYNLIYYSKDIDQMKNVLLKFVSKERINDIIENYQMEIELIPESHLIQNFRKTIRKLIKENYK